MPKNLFRVYVDEVGDRGTKPTSSPVFAMTALVVRDGANDLAMRNAHTQVLVDQGKPAHTVLHWRDNLKYHHQRVHITQVLGALPCRTVNVVVDKTKCQPAAYIMSNPEALYLWTARLLLERLSWLVDDHNGEAIVTFGEVKGFKATTLMSYVTKLKTATNTEIRWQAIRQVRMVPAANSKGVQFADTAAGALRTAVWAQDIGGVEGAYLINLAPIIYRRPPGPVTSYGLKGHPDATLWTTQPWWPNLIAALP